MERKKIKKIISFEKLWLLGIGAQIVHQQQYVSDRCRTAMYLSDWGFSLRPLLQGRGGGWLCNETGVLSARERFRLCGWSGFGGASS